MGDVTITRGIGFRDDMLAVTDWVPGSGFTITTDGDIATLTGNAAAGGSGENSQPNQSTNTYPKLMFRTRKLTGTGVIQLIATFTDASTQTDEVYAPSAPVETNFVVKTFTLTAAKTLDKLKFLIGNSSPVTSFELDFIMVFKETLTIPVIDRPLQLGFDRIQANLAVLDREGSIIQDLGSRSPEILLQGVLVDTTTPNNYTAAQWWNMLEGLVLEASGEVWQWLSSDNVNYKYLPVALNRVQLPVRSKYAEFSLRLTRWDVLSQTADRLGYSY